MKRRAFIKAFAGAVASVAIGMRVAQGMPKLLPPMIDLSSDTWYLRTGIEDMEHGEDLRIKATERFQYDFRDWRAVYGSPGTIDVRVDNP